MLIHIIFLGQLSISVRGLPSDCISGNNMVWQWDCSRRWLRSRKNFCLKVRSYFEKLWNACSLLLSPSFSVHNTLWTNSLQMSQWKSEHQCSGFLSTIRLAIAHVRSKMSRVCHRGIRSIEETQSQMPCSPHFFSVLKESSSPAACQQTPAFQVTGNTGMFLSTRKH